MTSLTRTYKSLLIFLQEFIDETHFIVKMDNKQTLGLKGDIEVKYIDQYGFGWNRDHNGC